MRIVHRSRTFLATLVVALAVLACSRGRPVATTESAVLTDTETVQAAYGPIRPQERPSFPVDERQRPYATDEDRTDRPKASVEPTRISESQ